MLAIKTQQAFRRARGRFSTKLPTAAVENFKSSIKSWTYEA
jgi:hypothetical protein